MELTEYQLFILSAGAVIAGIWLLVTGGDYAVNAAVALAERMQLSKIFIGATIIAFGTSVPELFTSINANLQGFPGISLGNVVGSNIANILLVIGATALYATLAVKAEDVLRDLGIMLIATVVLIGGMLAGLFPAWLGGLMFASLVGFVTYQYINNEIDTEEVEDIEMGIGEALLYLLLGFIGLALGSELLVKGAVVLGTVAGVPEAIIGLTAVAIGTSLPELFTCVAAAIKRETDLIFGNIIGSNTFNILSIVALTALIKPLEVVPEIAGIEMWFMAAVSLAFAAWLMMSRPIDRMGGVALLALYVAFTIYQFREPIGLVSSGGA
ncbi:MAG: calcium/sodium antiporter [Pseudomonadota bacterium]